MTMAVSCNWKQYYYACTCTIHVCHFEFLYMVLLMNNMLAVQPTRLTAIGHMDLNKLTLSRLSAHTAVVV